MSDKEAMCLLKSLIIEIIEDFNSQCIREEEERRRKYAEYLNEPIKHKYRFYYRKISKEIDTSIVSVVWEYLKLFIVTIVQNMKYHKKKCLFYCPAVNKKVDPRLLGSNLSSYSMTSVAVYENTLFSAKDFYLLLKENEDVIPKRSVYNLCMQRLLLINSVKPFIPSEDDEE